MDGTGFDGVVRLAAAAGSRRLLGRGLLAVAFGGAVAVHGLEEAAAGSRRCGEGRKRCGGKCCPRNAPKCCGGKGCCKKGTNCCRVFGVLGCCK